MKKLAIYPFSKKLSPIARFSDMLKEYQLSVVYAPKSFGLEGIDAGVVDGGGHIGVTVTSIGDDMPFDTILMDYHPSIVNMDAYLNIIKRCEGQNKKIIVTRQLSNKLFNNESHSFCILGGDVVPEENVQNINVSMGLFDIDVPVIMVLGKGEQCNKFDLQLAVRRHFVDRGYKVCQWGSKEYSELFGFPSLPAFVSGNSSLTNRIIYLNRHIYETVRMQAPDLIIIGVPGSIMKFSNQLVGDFGETSLIISNALKTDVAMLSTYSLPYKLEYFKLLQNYCKYRLDLPVKHFNIANTRCDYNRDRNNLSYLSLDCNFVMNELGDDVNTSDEINVFNMFNLQSIYHVCTDIENQLVNNPDVV
ncbi:MAG: TIGR04066 family peptide maturation system protein [Firmicutes bacterium]|nr:TIGR04066 family peptide maturation system protein [Bacillota bacterium]